jgi:hypothetical protein
MTYAHLAQHQLMVRHDAMPRRSQELFDDLI